MYNNKTVLITGGCSGIGKIMARRLLEAGAKVVVWDVSQQNIDLTLSQLSALGDISAAQVDVSNSEVVAATAAELLAKVGAVDVLINSAGVVVGRSFVESSVADIDRVMAINTNGTMYVTRAFVPAMVAQGFGRVCNIASSAGLVSNPNMSIYAASKWAVVGWSDSLRIELKSTGVKVSTIMPYYINTGMFDGVRSRIPILEPEKVSKTILKTIAKGEAMRTIPRWIYRTTRLAQTVFSTAAVDLVVGKMFGIYSTMDHFTGRK